MAFISFGFFAALTTVTQGHAYLLTLSSYVEAVKQVEILFALGSGALIFGETEGAGDCPQGHRHAGGRRVIVAGSLIHLRR